MSQGKTIDASPLTSRYKMLQKAEAYYGEDDERCALRLAELDRLYQQIVSLPILSLADAIDKLAFADHCLTEEHDIKEASNLIREVSGALLILYRATANPQKIHFSKDLDDPDCHSRHSPGE
jgi:hypothetical protein